MPIQAIQEVVHIYVTLQMLYLIQSYPARFRNLLCVLDNSLKLFLDLKEEVLTDR